MNDLSGVYVPRDYEDLYQHYIVGNGSSLGQVLVRRFVPGESIETKEDLLHDVYVRMVKKDVLKLFDHTKSNFGGVVYFVTRTVCVNYLKKKFHDPITNLKSASLEETSPETEGIKEKGVMYLDRMESESPGADALIAAIDAERAVRRLRKEVRLVSGARGKARATRLYRLMDYLIDGCTIKECAEKEGVTVSTIYNWMYYLKELVGGLGACEGC